MPEPVAAAIVTLTAEGAMRWLLMAVDNPKNAISISGSTGGAEISARGDRPCRARCGSVGRASLLAETVIRTSRSTIPQRPAIARGFFMEKPWPSISRWGTPSGSFRLRGPRASQRPKQPMFWQPRSGKLCRDCRRSFAVTGPHRFAHQDVGARVRSRLSVPKASRKDPSTSCRLLAGFSYPEISPMESSFAGSGVRLLSDQSPRCFSNFLEA